MYWIGSSRFTSHVKRGKKNDSISFKGAFCLSRACESHCPTVLSHNDYLAQSVPNYIYIYIYIYVYITIYVIIYANIYIYMLINK